MNSEEYGLTSENINLLVDIFKKYDDVNQVVLFGSRAMGTHHERSDIDLVIKNSTLTRHTIGRILMDIDESNIPYLADLQIFENISNPQLIDHIERVGRIIYSRSVVQI